MRNIITLAALAIVILACDDSHAAGQRVRNNGQAYAAPAAQSAGPFGRLMDLERRKNAALRQMFFGR